MTWRPLDDKPPPLVYEVAKAFACTAAGALATALVNAGVEWWKARKPKPEEPK